MHHQILKTNYKGSLPISQENLYFKNGVGRVKAWIVFGDMSGQNKLNLLSLPLLEETLNMIMSTFPDHFCRWQME